MMTRRENTKKAAQMEEKLTVERLAVLEVHLLTEQGWWQQQGRPTNQSMMDGRESGWLLVGGWYR